MNNILYIFLFTVGVSNAQTNTIFNEQAFGKRSSVYYIGSGAFKRHFDLNKIGKSSREYAKSPALVIGADFCFYPYASNAYLGIGPYFNSWIGIQETNDENKKIQQIFSNSTIAIKFTHHASFFVRKKLDVCTGYITGINLKYYHNYKINGVETDTPIRNTKIVPAIGITITIRYYAFKDIGVYIEGGIGYRVNMLNVGFCYKLKNKL